MAFRFRQFTVEDGHSALRVGTDAMLLGSWANPGMSKKILDIGTGCGVLALMMAQKSEATIEAVEIDQPSVIEAGNNFSNSPWPSRISIINDSIQAFSGKMPSDYGFIITNPPYFSNTLKSPNSRSNHTRHDDGLNFSELVQIVNRLLDSDGCFALILPSQQAEKFQLLCTENGLYPSRRLTICTKPATSPKRTVMEFKKIKTLHPESRELIILDRKGSFTMEYLSLTKEFHNF